MKTKTIYTAPQGNMEAYSRLSKDISRYAGQGLQRFYINFKIHQGCLRDYELTQLEPIAYQPTAYDYDTQLYFYRLLDTLAERVGFGRLTIEVSTLSGSPLVGSVSHKCVTVTKLGDLDRRKSQKDNSKPVQVTTEATTKA